MKLGDIELNSTFFYLFGASFIVGFLLVYLLLTVFGGKGKSVKVVISELWVYPIKGCKGFRLSNAVMTPRGLLYDRAYVLMDSVSKRFVSQRGNPEMALLHTNIDYANKTMTVNAISSTSDNSLDAKLTQLNAKSPTIDLTAKYAKGDLTCDVWGHSCHVYDCGDEAAEWFSEYFALYFNSRKGIKEDSSAKKVRLVKMADYDTGFTRPVEDIGGENSLSDSYPALLATEESLKDLNAKLATPVPMENFRPNIIVTADKSSAFKSLPPWIEDSWKAIYFTKSHVSMKVPFPPCGRCTVPTNDVNTGVLDAKGEPSKTMMTFRTGAHLGLTHENSNKQRKLHKNVYFGIHLAMPQSANPEVNSTELGTISVGEQVFYTDKAAPQSDKMKKE